MIRCPHCKTAINQIKVLQRAGGNPYLICPGCRQPVELRQKGRPVRCRTRPHQSKRERLRQRWAGREDQRFGGDG